MRKLICLFLTLFCFTSSLNITAVAETISCPECYKSIPEDSNFCCYCGTAINSKNMVNEEDPKTVELFTTAPSMNTVKKIYGDNYYDYKERQENYKRYIATSGQIYTLVYEQAELQGCKGEYLIVDYVKKDGKEDYDRKDAPFLGVFFKGDWSAYNNDEQREEVFNNVIKTLNRLYGNSSTTVKESVKTYMWATEDDIIITLETRNWLEITVSRLSQYSSLGGIH